MFALQQRRKPASSTVTDMLAPLLFQGLHYGDYLGIELIGR
jgi:hypothetical protein